MGWLIGWNDRKSLISHLTRGEENETVKQTVIAHQAAGNNLWTVFEQTTKATGEVKRFIILFMMTGGRNRDWGYKDISESMGPCEVSCPLKYLDMVPVGEGNYSAPWRERVRAYWVARSARSAPKRAATVARRKAEKARMAAGQAEEHARWERERAGHLARYATLLREGKILDAACRADWIRHYGQENIERIEREVAAPATA